MPILWQKVLKCNEFVFNVTIVTHTCSFIESKETSSFHTTDFHVTKKKRAVYGRFSESSLKILWKRFEQDPYIDGYEAENLAEILKVYPGKIRNWFKYQRKRGGLQEILRLTEGKHFDNILVMVAFIIFSDPCISDFCHFSTYYPLKYELLNTLFASM